MNLVYRDGVTPDDLAVNECVVRRAGMEQRLWIRVVDVRGHADLFCIPMNLGGPPDGRLWGLTRVSLGIWQVAPSIKRSTREGDVEVELWHDTPAIVNVPEPPPWERG